MNMSRACTPDSLCLECQSSKLVDRMSAKMQQIGDQRDELLKAIKPLVATSNGGIDGYHVAKEAAQKAITSVESAMGAK